MLAALLLLHVLAWLGVVVWALRRTRRPKRRPMPTLQEQLEMRANAVHEEIMRGVTENREVAS